MLIYGRRSVTPLATFVNFLLKRTARTPSSCSRTSAATCFKTFKDCGEPSPHRRASIAHRDLPDGGITRAYQLVSGYGLGLWSEQSHIRVDELECSVISGRLYRYMNS